MIKINPTNRRIVEFVNNADYVIQQLSLTGKRTRYLGILQFQKDHFDSNKSSIQKKMKLMYEKHAKVKDSGEFIYQGEGDKKDYVYTKEAQVLLDDDLEKFLLETKELEVDEIYYLSIKDLPKAENGEVSLSNNLIKIFSEFVISKEDADKLLYPCLNDKENDQK